MAEGELTPEQLIEQFRQMKVSDLLMSTLFTLSQLAYGKLEPSARDLDQARIAIDAMRALMPVVEPARAALERLVEWVLPVAEDLGAAGYLAIPAANAAERQIARHAEGATIEQIFAEQVRASEGEAVGG